MGLRLDQLQELSKGNLDSNDIILVTNTENSRSYKLKVQSLDAYIKGYDSTVSPLTEIYSVPDFNIRNVVDGKLTNPDARLEWTNMLLLPEEDYPITCHSGYDNSSITLSYSQSRLIKSYVIFMYISPNNIPPPTPSPATNQHSNSLWYYAGDYMSNTADIRCPENLFVGFWVGFRTSNQSQIIKRLLTY